MTSKKRTSINSLYRGENNQNSKTLFKERKSYKDDAFRRDSLEVEPPVFDLWYDKHFYGKINPKYHSFVIDESLLKRLSSTTTDKFAVDFVADAFNDLREYMFVSANKNKVSLDSPKFLRMEPVTAYNSFSTEYYNHISDLYFKFANLYLKENNREQKIRDFSSFMKIFMRYLNENSAQIPLSQTGFLKSRYCSIFTTGLVIELADADHGNDLVKYNDYINDINFLYYIQAADKFGFRIDKNAPWRLIADLKSLAMEKYMARYPQVPEAPKDPGDRPILQDPEVIFEPYFNKQFIRGLIDSERRPGFLEQIILGGKSEDLEKRREAKFVILDNPPSQETPDLEPYNTTPVAKINGNDYLKDVILIASPDVGGSISDGIKIADPDSITYQNKYWYLNKKPGSWGIRLSSNGSSRDPRGGETTYVWNLVEGDRGTGWRISSKDQEQLIFYPNKPGTYKISLNTQYEDGKTSRPVFAEIKVCDIPLMSPNLDAGRNRDAGDQNITNESVAWSDNVNRDWKRDWLQGYSLDAKQERDAYDSDNNPPGMYGWLTHLLHAPISPVYQQRLLRLSFGYPPTDPVREPKGMLGCWFPYMLQTNLGETIDGAVVRDANSPGYREWCTLSLNTTTMQDTKQILQGGLILKTTEERQLVRDNRTARQIGDGRESDGEDSASNTEISQRIQSYINDRLDPQKFFEGWWDNWRLGNFNYLKERFRFSGSIEQPYPLHPQSAVGGQIFTSGAGVGGYTYGGHGFGDYNCPDLVSTINEGVETIPGLVSPVSNTSPENSSPYAAPQQEETGPQNYGDFLQKKIIDFNFPKIMSVDLSDLDFQQLRIDYKNHLDNYSKDLEVWNKQTTVLSKYNEITEQWNEIRIPISFDNVFDFYYTESYLSDLEILKSIIPDFYNSFAIQNPFRTEVTFNCSLNGTSSRVKARNLISKEQIESNYDDIYWIGIYLNLRIKESMTRVPRKKQQQIYQKIKFLSRTNARNSTPRSLKLIEDLTKTVKNSP